ncbi:YunG family protein [Peteryoungia desertarenae]|uniref:YunG family protein n=1 Tax=Peteryoungia desertarenae TaxID=1813451 RepID=UPI003CCD1003
MVDLEKFADRLTKAWSRETSSLWSLGNPARGQCGVTSLVVQDVFGGLILKTPLPQGPHFYNSIDGRRFDFTADQFH